MITVKTQGSNVVEGNFCREAKINGNTSWSEIARRLGYNGQATVDEIVILPVNNVNVKVSFVVRQSMKNIDVNMVSVESSVIDEIGYENSNLYIIFNSNESIVYKYTDVETETFVDFLNAESKGEYFGEHIRGQYGNATKLELV